MNIFLTQFCTEKLLIHKPQPRHTCSQNWLDVKEQEFRNQIKKAMKTEFKTPYSSIFDKAELKLLNQITDINMKN